MCGIAGILNKKSTGGFSRDEITETIDRMSLSLSHRGPDSKGVWVDKEIAFGHRRLSILDPSNAGNQPMHLKESGLVLVFNGEIYNFRELRTALESLGHKNWIGNSDSEVILHSYQQWGMEGLKKLEGIFSLALWDDKLHRLILMRDRLGVKPLFYGDSKHGLAFGSEIKAVLAANGIDTSLADQSISEYMWYGNTYGNRTFYKGVHSLEPGHWIIAEKGQKKVEAWWHLEEWLNLPLKFKSKRDACELVGSALDKAVCRQLVSDVPIGIFLSGGVDSSAIAASAVSQTNEVLHSYSAGFDFSNGVNELPNASLVASHLGLDHHELKIKGSDLEEVLITLAKAHDEPFADAANIPLYLMCKKLSGQIKVVLQGDGGDELFGGYRRYAALRNSNLWKFWPNLLSVGLSKCGKNGKRIARIADSVGHSDPAMRMALLLTMEVPEDPPHKFFQMERQQELFSTTDPFLQYRLAAQRFHKYDPVQQMLLTDLTVQLPSQFLNKVDRATMAAGIEARVPLLDEKVVKLAVNIPSNWKVQGTQKKIILRDSQRKRLPDSILDGPKTGFGVPYERWMRSAISDFFKSLVLDREFLDKFSLSGKLIEEELGKSNCLRSGFQFWKIFQLALFYFHSYKSPS